MSLGELLRLLLDQQAKVGVTIDRVKHPQLVVVKLNAIRNVDVGADVRGKLDLLDGPALAVELQFALFLHSHYLILLDDIADASQGNSSEDNDDHYAIKDY